MTREIKFKTYRKEKMVDEYTTLEILANGTGFDTPYNEYIWCQSTGLKDKNGVEIYEGDIVSDDKDSVYHYLDRKYDRKEAGIWVDKKNVINRNIHGEENVIYAKRCTIVEWQDKLTGFFPFADSPENCNHCGGGEDPTKKIVIGNIYQNKDLLE